MADDFMTLKQVSDCAIKRLASKYGNREAEWMMRTIFENIKGYTPVDVVLHRDEILSDFIIGKINDVVARLMQNEPIQYIFGNTRFYGNTLVVSPATLIPRQETEELVDMIVKENQSPDLRVLDIGTGSGAIAVSLARVLKFPIVDAIDISADALDVARENARRLKVNVNFVQDDALTMSVRQLRMYDIIVSNPPYIVEKERVDMKPNVLEHEPWTALFVPDEEPLRFYEAIARYAKDALMLGGRLYFEINPLFVKEMEAMLDGYGFEDIAVIADMQGRQRFIMAKNR